MRILRQHVEQPDWSEFDADTDPHMVTSLLLELLAQVDTLCLSSLLKLAHTAVWQIPPRGLTPPDVCAELIVAGAIVEGAHYKNS